MNIQILRQYSSRTEYKVLRNWVEVTEKSTDELENGVCIIPAILLLKLTENDLKPLNLWWKEWGNQLIVLPPFHHIKLSHFLNINIDINVEEQDEDKYEGIAIREVIKTNLQPKWKFTNGNKIAVDIFEHSGSGCLTLTTIPLLDYRLSERHETCKKILFKLLNKVNKNGDSYVQDTFTIHPIHNYILILAKADVIEASNLSTQLNEFFNKHMEQNKALSFYQQLIDEKYLSSSGGLTQKGIDIVNKQGLRVFAREIQRWRYNDGEW